MLCTFFLLNFLGQPLSCHVGLVLLEGLIWCYHLQVTPNPPSPQKASEVHATQQSVGTIMVLPTWHSSSACLQSPHNQQNMSKIIQNQPMKTDEQWRPPTNPLGGGLFHAKMLRARTQRKMPRANGIPNLRRSLQLRCSGAWLLMAGSRCFMVGSVGSCKFNNFTLQRSAWAPQSCLGSLSCVCIGPYPIPHPIWTFPMSKRK